MACCHRFEFECICKSFVIKGISFWCPKFSLVAGNQGVGVPERRQQCESTSILGELDSAYLTIDRENGTTNCEATHFGRCVMRFPAPRRIVCQSADGNSHNHNHILEPRTFKHRPLLHGREHGCLERRLYSRSRTPLSQLRGGTRSGDMAGHAVHSETKLSCDRASGCCRSVQRNQPVPFSTVQ